MTDDPPPAPTWPEIKASLLNADAHITERYRCLFHAKAMAPSHLESVELLVKALDVQLSSVLLRHEICYVLGQLADSGEKSSIECLQKVLDDEAEDEIVRHEAAEALAAINAVDVLERLDNIVATSTSEPLRHTCELAVAGLRKKAAKIAEGETGDDVLPVCVCQYTSRDPAEGIANATAADVPVAGKLLLDESKSLYERYEGLFTLRNVGGADAIVPLGQALRQSSSAVLKHEVAFVIGQMESELATAPLIASLADLSEHGMVRHEAAIALGSIGTDEATSALRDYAKDTDQLVAESCEVAIATAAYWAAWEAAEARITGGMPAN